MPEKILFNSWDSPCGTLMLASLGEKLIMSDWTDGWHHASILKRFDKLLDLPLKEERSAVIEHAIDELNEYFLGRRKDFDVPFELYGTAFQIRVWKALQEIDYGQTVSLFPVIGSWEQTDHSRATEAVMRLKNIF